MSHEAKQEYAAIEAGIEKWKKRHPKKRFSEHDEDVLFSAYMDAWVEASSHVMPIVWKAATVKAASRNENMDHTEKQKHYADLAHRLERYGRSLSHDGASYVVEYRGEQLRFNKLRHVECYVMGIESK